jgi:transposase-like protein
LGVVGSRTAGHRGNLGEFFQELERRPTMAQTNAALSVEDVLAAGGGMQGLKDVLSSVVQDALQELIEAEVTARLGAGRWERSEERSGTRNGSRPRTVSTRRAMSR